MRPRETAKTKLVRLLFLVSNVLTLGLGLALCFLGGSQQVDPEARAIAANRTAGMLPALNGTLAGAEANAAPYSRMLMIGAVIVVESLLGVLGALRTQKHRDRRRGVLLLYHAVLLATASSCIWLAVMCLFFASQADECVTIARVTVSQSCHLPRLVGLAAHPPDGPFTYRYVDRYWAYIEAAFPPDISETDAVAMIDANLTSIAVVGGITGILLVVGLYCSAHLVGHRYLTRSMLMWINGLSIMGGAVLATSALVVANEHLGGDLLAYIVAALGGFAMFAGVLGTHGARGENTWTLLLYFLLLCTIMVGIVAAGIYLIYNAKPSTIRDNWNIVEEKIYPMTYDEAVATAALHFTELGVAATIVATILFVNAVSACYLRRRILKEGRFFEPFASDMQDSEWVDDDDDGNYSRGKRKAP